MNKIFTYQMDGLAYTVTLYEDPDNPGTFLADITVDKGAMDVNAIYFGDDDFGGDSAGLRGPLNMNGAQLDGQQVQWDAAVQLSRPGLGPEGEDKETYISSGETLTIQLDIDSLDEVDVFGIRATSTTTESGSIKAVSDEPEEPEEPEDDPVYDKVGFGVAIGENGGIESGVFVREDDLPEGQEGTFANYVDYYEEQYGDDPEFAISQLESVVVYNVSIEVDENGDALEIPEELFRVDAPEEGFQDADALIAAYEEAIDSAASEGAADPDGADLLSALSLDFGFEEDAFPEDEQLEDDYEMI